MYLRTTQRRNKDGSVVRYYALAENVRHPGKGYVEARVVHSFGRADRLDRAALERLVASIRRILEEAGGEAGARAGSRVGGIAIEAAFELGVVHVARALWAKLGIGEAVQARMAEQQLQAPHAAALLAMVAQRLDRPGSKLACHERWLDRVWLPEARELGLHQLYRAMDLLAEHGDAVEQAVFWRAADLFKPDVDLVFYDGTTAWPEFAVVRKRVGIPASYQQLTRPRRTRGKSPGSQAGAERSLTRSGRQGASAPGTPRRWPR